LFLDDDDFSLDLELDLDELDLDELDLDELDLELDLLLSRYLSDPRSA
jgi:hypothetical protein